MSSGGKKRHDKASAAVAGVVLALLSLYPDAVDALIAGLGLPPDELVLLRHNLTLFCADLRKKATVAS